MSSIVLSKGIRNNLVSLQKTADITATTQSRLATGKRVNSALDNPTNFFTAQSLSSRANDMSGLLDGISNAVKTIEAADKAITAITKLVESAQSIAKQARQDTSGAAQDNITAALGGATTKAGAAGKTLVANLSYTAGQKIKIVSTDTYGGVNTTKTYNFDISATSTVQSLADDINSKGIGIASITDDGKLDIKSNSSTSSLVISSTDSAGVALGTQGVLGTGAYTTTTADTSASPTRQALAKQFNDIRTQIDGLAKDAGFNGVNLLNGDDLKVVFNEKAGSEQNSLNVKGTTYSATSLGAKDATSSTGYNNFLDNNKVDEALKDLTGALSNLRTQSSTLGSNMSVVQTRQDFTKEMISTLETGSDNLVLADQNKEAANMLALQTRQQLSQSALSLANQADQGVLRLF